MIESDRLVATQSNTKECIGVEKGLGHQTQDIQGILRPDTGC